MSPRGTPFRSPDTSRWNEFAQREWIPYIDRKSKQRRRATVVSQEKDKDEPQTSEELIEEVRSYLPEEVPEPTTPSSPVMRFSIPGFISQTPDNWEERFAWEGEEVTEVGSSQIDEPPAPVEEEPPLFEYPSLASQRHLRPMFTNHEHDVIDEVGDLDVQPEIIRHQGTRVDWRQHNAQQQEAFQSIRVKKKLHQPWINEGFPWHADKDCTVPWCDMEISYLIGRKDEDEVSWELVCHRHVVNKNWRGFKIDHRVVWGTPDPGIVALKEQVEMEDNLRKAQIGFPEELIRRVAEEDQ